MKRLFDILLWGALAALLIAGFLQAHEIARHPSISLRFADTINGQAALRARQYSAENENTFWVTFWQEVNVNIKATVHTVQTPGIAFSGDGHSVWHAEYIAGGAPGSLDGSGIALSETLALRLFGSVDIIGLTLEADGETRTVRGVFRGEQPLALIAYSIEDTAQAWSGAELTGGISNPTRSDAESYAQAAGLGRPAYILMGWPKTFSLCLAAAPLVMLAVYGCILIAAAIKQKAPKAGAPLFFAGLIVFALILPVWLGAMPDWLIPTRWSDFSFWGGLISRAQISVREFLSADAHMRDVELRMKILGQIGVFILSVACGLAVCFRWHIRRLVSAMPECD